MAFGHESAPTRKYVYGIRETVRGRTDDAGRPLRFPGHQGAVDQLFLAHRLQNEVVALELARRAKANEIIHVTFPELDLLLKAAEALAVEVEALRTELKARNAAARSAAANRAFAREVKGRADALGAARAAHKVRKGIAYADPAVALALEENEAAAASAKARVRTAAVAAALYWATSLIVVQRVKRSGAPPKFKRWRGAGLAATQFQRKPNTGSPKEPVLDAAGEVRIHPRSGKPMTRHADGSSLRTDHIFLRNTQCYLEQEAGRPRYVKVHFRIGSAPDGAPIWAVAQAVYHRPLPPGAEIKWAYLARRRIGTHFKWEVHFDVAMSAAAWAAHDTAYRVRRGRQRAESGAVAVALGWRLIDGAVRVAVWAGDDGRTGEITIPQERVARWAFCDAVQSVRDKEFDASKAALLEWMRRQLLPAEWKERTKNFARWKSANNLAALVIWWRSNRLPNDGAIFRRLEGELVPAAGRNGHDSYTGGRLQDKHLYDLSEARRAKCSGWRKWFYREAALGLAARYRTVVVGEIDWHAIAENPAPEETDPVVNKRYRGIAACASLRDALADRLAVARVPAAGTTVTCHVCGGTVPAPGAGRWVRCERCGGAPMDRAENAAKNLLVRYLGSGAVAAPARVVQVV